MKHTATAKSAITFSTLILIIGIILLAIVFPIFRSTTIQIALIALISFFVFLGTGVFLYFYTKRSQERLKATTILDADSMSGVAFEQYVGALLKHKGFKIEFTPASGDYGVDIVAEKGNEKYAVQIKRYTHAVGRAAISDAVAGMNFYRCNKAMVVTNNFFTPAAKTLAQATQCVLIDRDTLISWIVEFQKD